jgi:hypothetical protein
VFGLLEEMRQPVQYADNLRPLGEEPKIETLLNTRQDTGVDTKVKNVFRDQNIVKTTVI